MCIHTPHSSSRSWFVSPRARSVAFVVAALCLAFTEGQTPPTSQTGATGDAPAAALDLAGLHADQAAALDRALSILGGGTSRKASRGFGISDNCGVCVDHRSGERLHFAIEYPDELPASGDAKGHGWHAEWEEGLPCLFSHWICVFVPGGGGPQMAQSIAGELTDAVVRAAAAEDAPLLAMLLALPDVHANFGRGAIQVAGCDGTTIAAHVPVPRDLLEEARVLATEALD